MSIWELRQWMESRIPWWSILIVLAVLCVYWFLAGFIGRLRELQEKDECTDFYSKDAFDEMKRTIEKDIRA